MSHNAPQQDSRWRSTWGHRGTWQVPAIDLDSRNPHAEALNSHLAAEPLPVRSPNEVPSPSMASVAGSGVSNRY